VQIEYNRQAKQYEWVDPNSGEILTAPSKCKGDLFKAAVGLLDPDLYTAVVGMIAKHPQLERVAWKAAELVTQNAVEIMPTSAVLAMVESSDGYGRYAIQHDYSCQCEHYTSLVAPMTSSGRRYCKHALSVLLWMKVRETRF